MARLPLSAGLLILFILSAGAGSAQPLQSGDTVFVDAAEAIQRAVAESPEIGQTLAQRSFAEAREQFAKASRFATEFEAQSAHALAPRLGESDFPDDELYLDPNLRNDWDNPSMFNQLEVEVVQPILTWGQLSGSISAARAGTDVTRAQVEEKTLEVATRTAEIYYSVLLTIEFVRLQRETGDILRRAKKEIQQLLDEGAEDVDDADLFQLLITEQDYNRSVIETNRNYDIALAALARQLFVPQNVLVLPTESTLEPLELPLDSLSHYLDAALLNRSELRQAAAGIDARQSLVKVARSDYYPKLFLGGSAKIAGTPGRIRQPNPFIGDRLRGRSVEAGLGFRQNLNFVQSKAKVRQAEAEKQEVVQQMKAARQLVQFEVEEAFHKMKIAKAAVDAQDEALRISKEWLQTESINFDLALGDTENLVRAVRSSLEQRAKYFDAVRRYNVSVVRLFDAAGILLHDSILGTFVEEE